jgi:glycosyltransferase involved in cell wall biosynthesis
VSSVQPDVVHATLWDATVPAQLAAAGRPVPLLITWAVTPNTDADLQELSAGRWKRQAVLLFDRLLGRLSKAQYHAVTAGVGRTMGAAMHVGQDRVHVGERGRDPASFRRSVDAAAVRDALGVPRTANLVLAVGRQDPQKGYSTLLAEFDRLASADHEARLVIAGRPGADSPALRAQVRELAAASRVQFVGHRDDVADLLAAADLMVCSSWREGAAGALVEAMAAGTPIVSVQLAGLEGVLIDGVNARVVPRSALGVAMAEVMADPELSSSLSRGARRTFDERFTLDRSVDRLLEIYRQVAVGPSPGTT